MSKKHCSRCGKASEVKCNPYNVTFDNFYFGMFNKGGEGHFCPYCASVFVKECNKQKGGYWTVSKDDEKRN
jgi:hypothetical protein